MSQNNPEDVLECPICNEKMVEMMILVSNREMDGFCNHCMCKSCLEKIIDNAQRIAPKCPACRRTIIGAEKNNKAIEIAESLQQVIKEKESHIKNIENEKREKVELQFRLEQLRNEKDNIEQDAQRQLHHLNDQLEKQKKSTEQDKLKLASLERSLGRLQEGSQQALMINQQLQHQIQLSKTGEERLADLLKQYEKQREEIEALAAQKTTELQQKLEEAEQKSREMDMQRSNLNSELERYKHLSQTLHAQLKNKIEEIEEMKTNPVTKISSQNNNNINTNTPTHITINSTLINTPVVITKTLYNWGLTAYSVITNPFSYGDIWKGPLMIEHEKFTKLERRGSHSNTPVWRTIDKNKANYVFKQITVFAPYKDPNSTETNNNGVIPQMDDPAEEILNEYNRSYLFYSSFREAMYMYKLKHPNILKLNGIVKKDNNCIYLVMPFMNCDLSYLACATPTYSLTLEDVQFIMYRIICAVRYLHSAEITHRDINPTSILVSWEDGENNSKKIVNAVLSSLGQARCLSAPYGFISEQSVSSSKSTSGLSYWYNISALTQNASDVILKPPSFVGTKQPTFDKILRPKYNTPYMAPELALLQEKGHTVKNFDWKKCDVWSIGCVIAELLRGGSPLFTSSSSKNLITEILRFKESYPKNNHFLLSDVLAQFSIESPTVSVKDMLKYLPPTKLSTSLHQKPVLYNTQNLELSEKCIDLVIKILAFNPDERPTCEELLQHQFFKGISKAALEIECSFGDSVTDINLVEFVISKCRGQ